MHVGGCWNVGKRPGAGRCEGTPRAVARDPLLAEGSGCSSGYRGIVHRCLGLTR
ncbi:hypothetical protein [Streptomyces sp. CL12-4]|uniref:hypothetical protein n=1 Tax=Streptomyces sp. CL12-4 TaxID=2810306 RepID=UPI001EFA7355|nr:hypothetical protein [Streptomyces sp. CL12-4]